MGNLAERDRGHPARPTGNMLGVQASTSLAWAVERESGRENQEAAGSALLTGTVPVVANTTGRASHWSTGSPRQS